MSSHGGGGRSSGGRRSGSGRGLALIEPTPPSVDQQPTPSNGDDHDEGHPGLSGHMSQTGSTSSVGNMYIYYRESGE